MKHYLNTRIKELNDLLALFPQHSTIIEQQIGEVQMALDYLLEIEEETKRLKQEELDEDESRRAQWRV